MRDVERPVHVTIVFSPDNSLSAEIWAKALNWENNKYGRECFKVFLHDVSGSGVFNLIVKENGKSISYRGDEIGLFVAKYSCTPLRIV